MNSKNSNEQARARREAAHDIPHAGTLEEISYCRRCGAPFFSTEPCPKAQTKPVQP